MGYKTYIKGKSVKLSTNFNSTEFDCHGNGCCYQTKINEQLVAYLQKIRDHFGKPISVTSGYRCPIHNSSASVGGATRSKHCQGDAADIVVSGVTPAEVAKYAESIGILGIGLYSNFVHIDTRTTKFYWYGHEQSPRSTFGAYAGDVVVETTTNSNTSSNKLNVVLNRGDSGVDVKKLQEDLIRLGYSCGVKGADGIFGISTYQAVVKFQRETGLSVDGIAGYQTLNAIESAINKLDSINTDTKYKVKVTASVLNVRSGAGMNYQIIRQILKNTVCTVIEEKNEWCKLADINGWVSKNYIQKV